MAGGCGFHNSELTLNREKTRNGLRKNILECIKGRTMCPRGVSITCRSITHPRGLQQKNIDIKLLNVLEHFLGQLKEAKNFIHGLYTQESAKCYCKLSLKKPKRY
jgi:hypothetical protein